MKGGVVLGVDATREGMAAGPPVRIVSVRDGQNEIGVLLEQLLQWTEAGVPMERVAVLARQNRVLHALRRACELQKIPVRLVMPETADDRAGDGLDTGIAAPLLATGPDPALPAPDLGDLGPPDTAIVPDGPGGVAGLGDLGGLDDLADAGSGALGKLGLADGLGHLDGPGGADGLGDIGDIADLGALGDLGR